MDEARNSPAGNASYFQLIAGVAVAGLALFGAGAFLYNLFAPGGWLARAFERSLAEGLAVILALLIVGVCVRLTAKEILRPV